MKTGFLALRFAGQNLLPSESASDGCNMHRIAVGSGVVSKIRLHFFLNVGIGHSLNPRYKSFLDLLRVQILPDVPSLSRSRCINTASARSIGDTSNHGVFLYRCGRAAQRSGDIIKAAGREVMKTWTTPRWWQGRRMATASCLRAWKAGGRILKMRGAFILACCTGKVRPSLRLPGRVDSSAE